MCTVIRSPIMEILEDCTKYAPRSGLTPADNELARWLSARVPAPLILTANKAEHSRANGSSKWAFAGFLGRCLSYWHHKELSLIKQGFKTRSLKLQDWAWVSQWQSQRRAVKAW